MFKNQSDHPDCVTLPVLLTGASGNLGGELARQLARPGVRLSLWGRDLPRLESTAQACRDKGIHPVIGCEVYVCPDMEEKRVMSREYSHLVLLCENNQGYQNLMQLVSEGYTRGFYYRPRIDLDFLAAHSDGLQQRGLETFGQLRGVDQDCTCQRLEHTV